jgi:hypothetical protein
MGRTNRFGLETEISDPRQSQAGTKRNVSDINLGNWPVQPENPT